VPHTLTSSALPPLFLDSLLRKEKVKNALHIQPLKELLTKEPLDRPNILCDLLVVIMIIIIIIIITMIIKAMKTRTSF
tara:strand:+ start:1826 stop:2059 length:234 start_codon:yes stop_codon:yes gene_type:complete